jgi:uncharacterized damage-inducible protein DinB
MSERARALAEQFERANEEFVAAVAALPDERWRAPCSDEERSVCAVAHHTAEAYRLELDAFRVIADGAPLAPIPLGQLHEANVRRAARDATCTRAEVLDLARRNAADAVAFVRGLSDEQLARTGVYVDALGTRSLDQLIERILIGHIRGHLRSIASTTAG